MRFVRVPLLAALLAFLAALSPAQIINPGQLQKALDDIVKADQVPGALLSVLPAGPGASANLTSGVSNLQTNAPFATTMGYRIGSVTKTFVATVVLQLIEANTLIPGTNQPFTLDTTATQVLGAQALQTIPFANQVTVRELLNMTSGIYDYNDAAFQGLIYANPGAAWTPQQILATLQGKGPIYPPGSSCGQCPNNCVANTNCFNYSNTNYIVLGMMIETLTSDTVQHQLQTRVFGPLGLVNTYFPTTPALTGSFSRGYTAAGITTNCGPVVPNGGVYNDTTTCFNPTSAWTAGAIVSNTTDMEKWLPALLTGQGVLSPAMQAQRLTFVQGNLESLPIQYGLGIMQVQTQPGNPHTTFRGHAGEFWGFSNAAFQGINCQVQILDAVNAFQGVLVNEQETAPYAELFFFAGNTVCGGETPAAARRTSKVRVKHADITGGLFWKVP
jgi:D-alanyl-D-alanine carboxypeptidase